MVLGFFFTGETQEECNKCGKVYMVPESDKDRDSCPECAPSSLIITDHANLKTTGLRYGDNSTTMDSEDDHGSSSMGSGAEDRDML